MYLPSYQYVSYRHNDNPPTISPRFPEEIEAVSNSRSTPSHPLSNGTTILARQRPSGLRDKDMFGCVNEVSNIFEPVNSIEDVPARPFRRPSSSLSRSIACPPYRFADVRCYYVYLFFSALRSHRWHSQTYRYRNSPLSKHGTIEG